MIQCIMQMSKWDEFAYYRAFATRVAPSREAQEGGKVAPTGLAGGRNPGGYGIATRLPQGSAGNREGEAMPKTRACFRRKTP